MYREKKLTEIFNEDIEYFSYSEDDTDTKFMIVKLSESKQWMKIMLYEDYTWMSSQITNGSFSLIALAESEPKYAHYRKSYLFGMPEELGLPALASTIKRVSNVLNDKRYIETEPIPYALRALKSFNVLFEGKL